MPDEANAAWKADSVRQLVLGPFVWGYLLSIMPAGCLIGWTGGHKMLGYSHLIMSLATLLNPTAVHFMHSYTVAGLKFIAGMMAVSIISCVCSYVCFSEFDSVSVYGISDTDRWQSAPIRQ